MGMDISTVTVGEKVERYELSSQYVEGQLDALTRCIALIMSYDIFDIGWSEKYIGKNTKILGPTFYLGYVVGEGETSYIQIATTINNVYDNISESQYLNKWNNFRLDDYGGSGWRYNSSFAFNSTNFNCNFLKFNCPIYKDRDTAIAHLHDYVDRGDWVGSMTSEPPYLCDWEFTAVGTQNPIIKIRGTVDVLTNEDSKFYGLENQTYYRWYVTGESTGTEDKKTTYGTEIITSYEDIVEEIDKDFWDKVVEKIASWITHGVNYTITMYAITKISDTENGASTGAYITFDYSGVIDYGVIQEGDTITQLNEQEYDENEDDDTDDSDDKGEGDVPIVSGSGLLTTTYAVNSQSLQAIGQSLWSNDFYNNIVKLMESPLENIVSIKLFPFTISSATTETEIKIGNVSMGQNGIKLANNRLAFRNYSIDVQHKFNSYLDYGGFTNISIFIPYIGMQTLDTNKVMGERLKLSYFIDLVTGNMKVQLTTTAQNKKANSDYVLAEWSTQIGEDVPISAVNRGQVEMGFIQGAIGTGTALATGNVLGGLSSALSTVSNQYHTESKGVASPSTSVCGCLKPYLIYDTPLRSVPSDYGKLYGYPCNTTKTLKDVHGYTVINFPRLDNMPITNEEKELLEQAMQEGLILP